MSRCVLIVPDKFKGTLSARAAAEAIAWGWSAVHPGDQLELLPMSDGGDGFGVLLTELLRAETRSVTTVDAARRPRTAEWGWDSTTHTAVIESTQSIGLALLPAGEFHPHQLDTWGLGETIAAALQLGAQRLIIGLGGSATNDGGFGMARALGARFIDGAGNEIIRWPDLIHLKQWILPRDRFAGIEVIAACDVDNPLLGPNGCSRVYGPQKGLSAEDFPTAEAALGQLAAVTFSQLRRDVAGEAGSGAAGGLGFALRAFLGGRLESGFDIFAQLAGLAAKIAAADLILTGEGGLDRQTLMGKGTGRVAKLARAAGKPCYALAGIVEAEPELPTSDRLFTETYALVPEVVSLAAAKADAGRWLEELARRVARTLTPSVAR